MEIRRSYDCLISTMGFSILVRRNLYIEPGSCFPVHHFFNVLHGMLELTACHVTWKPGKFNETHLWNSWDDCRLFNMWHACGNSFFDIDYDPLNVLILLIMWQALIPWSDHVIVIHYNTVDCSPSNLWSNWLVLPLAILNMNDKHSPSVWNYLDVGPVDKVLENKCKI